MSLNPPPNFWNDIQGKDTALVPIVVIGTRDPETDDYSNFIYLSTNSLTLELYGFDYTFKPLLLNIPSLKESIDIEKRNYKSSSINIDISNFPYEGKIFSDLVGDTSLINTECRVFWVSPSVSTIGLYDSWQYVS